MKIVRTGAFIIISAFFILSFTSTWAQAAESSGRGLVYRTFDATKEASLAVTDCLGEAEHECVLYELKCSRFRSLSLRIQGAEKPTKILRMLKEIVSSPPGSINMVATLSGGRVNIGLAIWNIVVGGNDADGVWDLEFQTNDASEFFGVVSPASADGLLIKVRGRVFPFWFKTDDTVAISSFKKACLSF